MFDMQARPRSQPLVKPKATTRLRAHGRDHVRGLIFSLGKLYRQPFATTLALLMVAIALALPACLYVLLDNLQAVTYQWREAVQITVFLKDQAGGNAIEKLRGRFTDHAKIAGVEYISAEKALKELRARSEFKHLLDGLQENPLPPVFVLDVHQTLQAYNTQYYQLYYESRCSVAQCMMVILMSIDITCTYTYVTTHASLSLS